MTVDKAALRELLEKATPAPWHTATECPGRCCWHLFKGLPIYGEESPVVMGECAEGDAALIAAARNALPALLAENDALRAALQEMVDPYEYEAAADNPALLRARKVLGGKL